MASNKINGGRGRGLQLTCGRPTFALCPAFVLQTLYCSVCVEGSWLISALSLKHRNQKIAYKARGLNLIHVIKQEGQEALNRSPEYTGQKSNI